MSRRSLLSSVVWSTYSVVTEKQGGARGAETYNWFLLLLLEDSLPLMILNSDDHHFLGVRRDEKPVSIYLTVKYDTFPPGLWNCNSIHFFQQGICRQTKTFALNWKAVIKIKYSCAMWSVHNLESANTLWLIYKTRVLKTRCLLWKTLLCSFTCIYRCVVGC